MFTVNSKVLNIIDNVWFCTVTIGPRTTQPHTTTTLVNKFTCVGLTCSLSIVEDQVTDNSTSYVSLKNTNSYTKLQFTRLIQQHLFGKIKSSTIYQKKIHTIEITIHPHQSQEMTMTLQYKTNPSQAAVKAIHPTAVKVTRWALKSCVSNSTPCWTKDHPSASIAPCD